MSDGKFKDGSAGAARLADAGAQVGPGVRAWLGADVQVGSGVRIGNGAVLVADRLVLGDEVRIGDGVDLRSGSVEIGARCELLPDVKVLVADSFALGPAGRIEGGVSITCRTFSAGRLFYFGHDSSVGYGGTTASTAHVRLGDRVALGPHSILNANLPIELGDQVGSGCNLTIWTHGFHFGHRLSDGYDATFRGVEIHPNVWLGFHVTVLPGVRIGANTIVAAGAVVSRDLPEDVLAGGIPAKPLKPLVTAPLTDETLWDEVETLLDGWCTELAWKGVSYERTGPREVLAGDVRVICLEPDEQIVDTAQPHMGQLVIVTLGPRPDVSTSDLARVVFELRSGVLRGRPSPVAHDLRDHLRRHALPCGDEETFSGLPSGPFARLTGPVPLQSW